MLIYVNCITYGYFGKGHLFTVNDNDTLQSLKEKIVKHFGSSEHIDMFDDATEQLLDDYDRPLRDSFSSSPFYSVTFGE